MTKQEFIESMKARKAERMAKLAEAAEVKKAEDTIPEVKVVDDVKAAEGMPHSELPTQKDVEKEVAAAVDPVVDADKDGVSKNGGEEELTADSVEAEKAKEDKAAKDVINVTGRTYEENTEAQAELMKQLKEAETKNEKLVKEVALIKESAIEALKEREQCLASKFQERMGEILVSIRDHGKALEESLKVEAEKAAKTAALAEAFSKSSLKLNKILIESLKSSKAGKKMVCVESYKARISGRAKRFGN